MIFMIHWKVLLRMNIHSQLLLLHRTIQLSLRKLGRTVRIVDKKVKQLMQVRIFNEAIMRVCRKINRIQLSLRAIKVFLSTMRLSKLVESCKERIKYLFHTMSLICIGIFVDCFVVHYVCVSGILLCLFVLFFWGLFLLTK